jgi:hypothetical protein
VFPYLLNLGGLFLDQHSLQYIGLSGAGSKGSSVISAPHSPHFQFPLTISRGPKFPPLWLSNFLKTIEMILLLF